MAGKGSKSGRTKNQDAIGTRLNRSTGGSGRGRSTGMVVNVTSAPSSLQSVAVQALEVDYRYQSIVNVARRDGCVTTCGSTPWVRLERSTTDT